jgi:hypothetical protein
MILAASILSIRAIPASKQAQAASISSEVILPITLTPSSFDPLVVLSEQMSHIHPKEQTDSTCDSPIVETFLTQVYCGRKPLDMANSLSHSIY